MLAAVQAVILQEMLFGENRLPEGSRCVVLLLNGHSSPSDQRHQPQGCKKMFVGKVHSP